MEARYAARHAPHWGGADCGLNAPSHSILQLCARERQLGVWCICSVYLRDPIDDTGAAAEPCTKFVPSSPGEPLLAQHSNWKQDRIAVSRAGSVDASR
jgi:hypothetical protein